MLNVDYKTIILFTVSLITSYLSLLIIRDRAKYDNMVFALFILSVSFWSLGVAFFNLSNDIVMSEYIVKFYYIAAALIPLFFSLFSLSFPYKNKNIFIYQNIFISVFCIISYAIIFYPNFIIKSIVIGEYNKVILDLKSYYIYFAYFLILMIFSYINLFRSYFLNRNNLEILKRVRYMSIGTLIPFLFGMYFNLILPIVNYNYIWVGPIAGLIVVFVVLYSIQKFKLFNTKVIFAEFFTFLICLLVFIRAVITQDTNEKYMNIGMFVVVSIFGLFLIKSVRKESSNNEKIKTLANNLTKSNDKLEDANNHLKELDQKKSEFMSVATHQLRAPLTAMRGYYSMIQEGTFGKIDNPEIEDVIGKISRSTTDLTMIVEDYLNISRIEQGSMQYNFVTIDIAEIVRDVVKEVSPTVKNTGITLDLKFDESQKYKVSADQGKMKQVVFNIIDNSIKYTPKGGIVVSIEKIFDKNVRISIKDTGVGIKPGVIPQLFQKFTRAPDASETNILGTGLGLYVADQILKAHDGRAWAESEGQGKGSQFYIELSLIK